ncbi:MAG: MaoC family dehydratase N-terminal domain-containing protein [Acidobacteria bacterium]|nr:MaoC family dehydratase N-terminal domain-containing protein [Acidobacteriota bacterium]
MQFNDLFDKLFTTTIIFSQQDINQFAEISGDNNPIHIDVEFAANSKFGKTIAHGMLVYAVISKYLSIQFPLSIQISNSLSFLSPVYVEEELILTQEIISATETILQVKTLVTKPDKVIACQSLATLKIS